MGNAFYDGHWVLDTGHNTAFLNGITGVVLIQRLKWQPNASGDDLVIKDKDAVIKVDWDALAATPAGDLEQDFGTKPLKIEGPVLHTIDGGTLYVELA